MATHPGARTRSAQSDIVNGQVRTADIAANTVYPVDVRDDYPRRRGNGAADLGPGSVAGSELASDAIPADGSNKDGSTKLAVDSVDLDELDANSVRSSVVEDNSLTGSDIVESTLVGVNADQVDGGDLCRTAGTLSLNGDDPPVTVCTGGSLSLIATCDYHGTPGRSHRGPASARLDRGRHLLVRARGGCWGGRQYRLRYC